MDKTRLKAKFIKVLLYWISVVVIVWIIAGCGLRSGKLPTFMRSELLYLKDIPYSRLYVEVDIVEGVEMPDDWLDTLKTSLETYCSKPDGIEVIQDPPIPLSEVKGMPVGAASTLYCDGPGPNNGSQPAYLHLFFYDKNVGSKTEKGPAHVSAFCPCGILFNVGYLNISKGKVEEFILKHELGHVFGLCKNPEHSDGAHCKNQRCLMYKKPGLFPSIGILLGSRVKKQLCADCQRDLETMKSEDVDPKLVFKGPFLIRREDGYSVASLPFCDVIIPTPVENTFDWTELLSYLKEMIREERSAASKEGRESRKRNWFIRGYWDGSLDKGVDGENMSEHVIVLFKKAADDPSPLIKNYANFALKQIEKEQD